MQLLQLKATGRMFLGNKDKMEHKSKKDNAMTRVFLFVCSPGQTHQNHQDHNQNKYSPPPAIKRPHWKIRKFYPRQSYMIGKLHLESSFSFHHILYTKQDSYNLNNLEFHMSSITHPSRSNSYFQNKFCAYSRTHSLNNLLQTKIFFHMNSSPSFVISQIIIN